MITKRIGFIGGGNMASCIFSAVRGKVSGDNLYVSGPHVEKLDKFRQQGARVGSDNTACARASDLLLLGVKPQVLTEVLQRLKQEGVDFTSKLVISMAAGFPLATLQALTLPQAHLVRIMPNTPAKIGAGVTAISYSEAVTPEEKTLVTELLSPLGLGVECSEEELNVIGAVCGCGPAFVFRFMEALCAEAVRYGFSGERARELVTRLLSGSVKLVEDSPERSLAELREAVTSKGGTTYAGLQAMSAGHFEDLMQSVIAASLSRTKELQDMFKLK